MNKDNGIGIKEAEAFLAKYYAPGAIETFGIEELGVELLGEGAWSRCFGFCYNGEDLAIRFGNYVEDFEKDQRAYGYAGPDLRVPQVLDIGQAYDGHYAISTQVHGVPLESVDATMWLALVPSIVAALEAMRTADLSATTGFGGWDKEGNASSTSWSEHLLSVVDESADPRGQGWRETLAASSEGAATFTWGVERLKQVVRDDVPRCLLHCDLINRNVLVEKGRISGVFDWGCSRYGDHLYELAWFEFWSSWYPELDMQLLRSALEQRWHEIGYDPHQKEERLAACYLHIGLDHLRYNASIGDGVNLSATAQRMRELTP